VRIAGGLMQWVRIARALWFGVSDRRRLLSTSLSIGVSPKRVICAGVTVRSTRYLRGYLPVLGSRQSRYTMRYTREAHRLPSWTGALPACCQRAVCRNPYLTAIAGNELLEGVPVAKVASVNCGSKCHLCSGLFCVLLPLRGLEFVEML
jgi:hypothetical protein